MSMTFTEAKELQEYIGSLYPSLDVIVRQIGKPDGDEFCCFIVRRKYFLWNAQDWLDYSKVHFAGLHVYTEEAHVKQTAKIRASRESKKQKKERIPA